ncbi:MAG: TonB-dependent receptor, partial [Campylobacterales bacterium]
HDSVGKEATTYEGASDDWTGFDHSFRPFPGAFTDSALPVVGSTPPTLNDTAQELRAMLQKRDVNTHTTSVPYGGEVQVEYGKEYTIADEHKLSVLATYGYKGESSLRTYTSYDYLVSRDGLLSPEPDNVSTNDLLRTTIQHGGIVNLGYRFRNVDLQYTKLYVLNTLDQTRDVNGTFGENNSKEHQYYFEWQERELNIDQLSGGIDYRLGVDNRFDFGAEYARASEYVPNDVYYNYKQYFSTQPYVFARPDSMLTYSYRTTDDALYNIYLKNRAMVPMLSEDDYLEAGYVTEHKEREGRRVDLQMQSRINDDAVSAGPINGIINYGDGSDLDFSLTSLPRDQYNAELDRNAYYVKGLVKPTDALEVTLGARYVDLRQKVEQYKVQSNVVVLDPNTLTFNKLLPSIGMTYRMDKSNQFRLAYSETFVYPDFREFVNAEFIHPIYLAKVSGNPDLIETDIQNLDARYEYYMNETDVLTAAVFYKHMDNPIEDTRAFTTGTLPRFSFDNSKAADLAGFE